MHMHLEANLIQFRVTFFYQVNESIIRIKNCQRACKLIRVYQHYPFIIFSKTCNASTFGIGDTVAFILVPPLAYNAFKPASLQNNSGTSKTFETISM